jgi:hypothetical protein
MPLPFAELNGPVSLVQDRYRTVIEVTIHGVKHYLHSSTARELQKMLSSNLTEWNKTAVAAGWPAV